MDFPRRDVGRFAVVCGVVVTLLTAAGCEPLRKKFVRKKKEGTQSSEVVPILDPIDYPDKVETVGSAYQQRYALWGMWQKELLTDFEDRAADKKIRFDFDKSLAPLAEMHRLLTGETQESLGRLLENLRDIRRQMEAPSSRRDDASLRRRIDKAGRAVKKDFKYEKVQDALIP